MVGMFKQCIEWSIMLNLLNWRIYLYAAAATFIIAVGAYAIGHHQGVTQCNEERNMAQAQQALEQQQANMRAAQTQAVQASNAAQALAQQVQTTQTRTQELTKEVKHEPIIVDGHCRPHPDSVRAWNAANSGHDAPDAARQRDN